MHAHSAVNLKQKKMRWCPRIYICATLYVPRSFPCKCACTVLFRQCCQSFAWRDIWQSRDGRPRQPSSNGPQIYHDLAFLSSLELSAMVNRTKCKSCPGRISLKGRMESCSVEARYFFRSSSVQSSYYTHQSPCLWVLDTPSHQSTRCQVWHHGE